MTDKIIVLTTTGSQEEARKIGRSLVEQGLAACVNIVPQVESIYRWQGAIETAEEAPAILKTTAETTDALIARISGLHSYEVPCIAVWPIEKLLLGYSEWVEQTVRAGD